MPWIILTLSPSFFLSLTHTLSSVSVLIDSFITLILLILLFLLNPLGYSIKGAVRDSGPTRFFCQIQQIALHGPLAVCLVFALKNNSGVCEQSRLCKWETNIVAQPLSHKLS